MTDCIELVQPFSAPRDKLWAALCEPGHLANWQADTASGGLGEGRIRLGWPALGVETELRVERAEPQERLVLSSGRSQVTFQIEGESLRLLHDGLSDDDEREGVKASWQVALGLLHHYLREHFNQPRAVHWTVTPAPTTAAAAHVFYSDGAALKAWLTLAGSGVGESGSECNLTFRWGEPLTGIVLEKARDRDVAITWLERDSSVLVMRTLPSPFVPEERILALSWSHWNCAGDDQDTQEHFKRALGSLKQLLVSKGRA